MEPKTFLKGVAAFFIIKWIIGIVVVVLLLAALMVSTNQRAQNRTNNSQEMISEAQLQEANGKNGRNCWVAVDGVVYEISGSSKWEDGQHTTSEGAAYCGADMSQVIDKAPHGRKMLDQLEIVGKLQ